MVVDRSRRIETTKWLSHQEMAPLTAWWPRSHHRAEGSKQVVNWGEGQGGHQASFLEAHWWEGGG